MAQNPTLRDHLSQGKRNEKIAQWLFPVAPEWAIVILFYASVRYASALEIHLGWKASRSHKERMGQLRQISRKWRYQRSFIPQPPLLLTPFPLPTPVWWHPLFLQMVSDWHICEKCVEEFKRTLSSHGVEIPYDC
ncbi:MAG: hypothetical protein ACK4I8_07910 [Armatimonadota bacterium]